MQKHQNIKALFFLGIFSIMLTHQFIPHLHHQHVEINHQEETHTHNHQHHHHEKTDVETLQKGFLDLFLDTHSHNNTALDVLVIQQTNLKKLTFKKEIEKLEIRNYNNLISLKDGISFEKLVQPPDKPHQKYYSNCSLRGPPILG